jgi:hypothetical protein
MRAELVPDALEMANGLRRPRAGLIARSDRGSQYTSLTYTDRLDELTIDPSVGSKGDACDNAMAEAWVATFKSELVDGRRFPSLEHAEHEVLLRQITEPPTGPGWITSCQSALRAASSMEASMLSKSLLSIVSITGPVSRPMGPPLGTYR